MSGNAAMGGVTMPENGASLSGGNSNGSPLSALTGGRRNNRTQRKNRNNRKNRSQRRNRNNRNNRNNRKNRSQRRNKNNRGGKRSGILETAAVPFGLLAIQQLAAKRRRGSRRGSSRK